MRRKNIRNMQKRKALNVNQEALWLVFCAKTKYNDVVDIN